METGAQDMNDRLVTLIGGGGFLGRYIAQDLLAAGARLRIAQRDPRAAWFLRPLGMLGQTQFVAADVTRRDTIERAVAGADAVINLAGTFGAHMAAVQAGGARHVAEAAAAAGAKALVHVSALGADPASPAVYARLKAEGEAAVHAHFPTATILRPSTIFGREDQFVNRFAAMLARFPLVPVIRAETKLQPVFVGDVAAAAVAALCDPARFGGKTFELGGPDVLTMEQLYRWIARAIGRDPAIVSLPDAIGASIAMLGALPGAPITRDQWKMLLSDNVVSAAADGLATLGIAPTPLDAVAPAWLVRFRRNGRFASEAAA